jgi:hypothetical protein
VESPSHHIKEEILNRDPFVLLKLLLPKNPKALPMTISFPIPAQTEYLTFSVAGQVLVPIFQTRMN